MFARFGHALKDDDLFAAALLLGATDEYAAWLACGSILDACTHKEMPDPDLEFAATRDAPEVDFDATVGPESIELTPKSTPAT